jgi:hypothetical protein
MSGTSSKSPVVPNASATAALVSMDKETEMIRHALYWLSAHPELTPFASVLGKYAAKRAMNACMGPQLSNRCEHCLQYMGLSVADAGVSDLLHCSTSLFYQEVMQHPIESLHIAQQSLEIARWSIDYITKAIHTLANLPDAFEKQHAAFARFLWHHKHEKGLATAGAASHAQCPVQTMTQGLSIYNDQNHSWGQWLHMGLPHILSELEKSSMQTEEQLKEFIAAEYNQWRKFGQDAALHLHHPLPQTAPPPGRPRV